MGRGGGLFQILALYGRSLLELGLIERGLNNAFTV